MFCQTGSSDHAEVRENRLKPIARFQDYLIFPSTHDYASLLKLGTTAANSCRLLLCQEGQPGPPMLAPFRSHPKRQRPQQQQGSEPHPPPDPGRGAGARRVGRRRHGRRQRRGLDEHGHLHAVPAVAAAADKVEPAGTVELEREVVPTAVAQDRAAAVAPRVRRLVHLHHVVPVLLVLEVCSIARASSFGSIFCLITRI